MTYGDNTTQLREHLTVLLRQHRIAHFAVADTPTVPESTTPAERADLIARVERYRYGVATWCLEAVTVSANADRNLAPEYRLTGRFEARLRAALNGVDTGPPSLSDLTTAQSFPLVETWRQAARAAALGEHDFGDGPGSLSEPEARIVVKDAADLVRGLVALDARYANLPGWHRFPSTVRLVRAAEACSTYMGNEAGYTVDHRGWRPAPALIDGPARPGMAGVLQAQHNTMIALGELPTALNLRRVIHSQALMSQEAAQRSTAPAPELVVRFAERADTYQVLLRETRELGGLIGRGAVAQLKQPTP